MTRDDQERNRAPRRDEGEAAPPRGDALAVAAGAGDTDARFLALAENASDAIFVIDDGGVIRFANRAAEEIFGHPVAELIGQSLTLLMPEYLRPAQRAGMARYLETGERHISWRGVEMTGLHRTGRELDLEISFGEFARGGRRYFAGSARDISVRKRAQESLRRAEGAQRFLANASELLASSLDYETTLASVARLAVPYLADWCLIDLRDGERIERVAVAHEDAAKVEAVWEAVRRASVNAGASEGVAKVIRTGRAELLPELTEATLAAAFPDPEKLRLVRGLNLRSAMIVPMVAHERTLGAISFASAESGRRYAPADLALAEDLARRAALAVDNARLYREAREVNRLKDEFLATLSHELRTPLTAILGWSGLLRTVRLDAETTANALQTIERNARSQKQLIDDLLDASRIITGKLRLEMKPTPLAPVVTAAVESMRPAAAAKSIALRLALDGGALVVAGDAERLQQIVWNLLSNAVKFTPREGRVEVALARDGSDAVISVSDTGVGIAPDFLPLVFDRFRQADASTTRAYGGLGLGLSIMRHLVGLHGGRVSAESGGEGHGATFRVRLPLAPVAEGGGEGRNEDVSSAAAGARDEEKQRLGGLRVLVVDDDPDTLLMLHKTLERYGAVVETCESVAAALATLDDSPAFDVLVSDIGMPVEDGYTLMRRIIGRARERGIAPPPAIALTAYARQEDHDAALGAGFDAHVAKPVTPAQLVEAVAKLAGRAPKT
ncbi:MAG TPA: ATP-binding protein [Pyrinomonadaceae bacterium]|jgi:PAS domain S-box-containing protein